MKSNLIILFALCSIFGYSSCYKDSQEDLYGLGAGPNCDTTAVKYSTVVNPIMTKSCAYSGCHDATTQASGINLSTYPGTKTVADNGKLIASIKHDSGVSPMPQGAPKLDACTILKIQVWINDGAPNN